MPQVVNVTEQEYQSSGLSGATPGGSQAPNDGQDQVIASSVYTDMQNNTNTMAWITGLMLGSGYAPPYTQPPGLTTSGPGSGVSKIQTLPVGYQPSFLQGYFGANGDLMQVPFAGLYVMINSTFLPVWISSASYAYGTVVTSGGQIWAAISTGTSGSNAPSGGSWTWGNPYNDNLGSGGVNWINLTAATPDNFYTIANPAPTWATSTAYSLNQYITDTHSNVWIAMNSGVSNGTASPFPSSPTTGVTTQVDNAGTNQITWGSVGAIGQWVHIEDQLFTSVSLGTGSGGLIPRLSSNGKLDDSFLSTPQVQNYGTLNFISGTTPYWSGDGGWSQSAIGTPSTDQVTVTVTGGLPWDSGSSKPLYIVQVSRFDSGGGTATVVSKSSTGFVILTNASAGYVDFSVIY